jgi:hypothetical protein
MPLVDLSHDELKRAALSARAQAFRHEQQAKDGPDPAEPHLEQAKRYREQWAADNPAWGFAIDCPHRLRSAEAVSKRTNSIKYDN